MIEIDYILPVLSVDRSCGGCRGGMIRLAIEFQAIILWLAIILLFALTVVFFVDIGDSFAVVTCIVRVVPLPLPA